MTESTVLADVVLALRYPATARLFSCSILSPIYSKAWLELF